MPVSSRAFLFLSIKLEQLYYRPGLPHAFTDVCAPTDEGSLTIVLAILRPGSPVAEYTGQNVS